MGDNLKLSKESEPDVETPADETVKLTMAAIVHLMQGSPIADHEHKRHRSSSSIVGSHLEGTRSERRINLKGVHDALVTQYNLKEILTVSIPEVDDKFALADARCVDLQEKIDLVKSLKRKRKLKKRSSTRLGDIEVAEDVPYISVRTLPKNKGAQQAAAARRHLVLNPTRGYTGTNPRRSYVDSNQIHNYTDDSVSEQHRILEQVREFNYAHKQQRKVAGQEKFVPRLARQKMRLARADGDSVARSAIRRGPRSVMAVACGDDDVIDSSSGQNINETFQSSSEKPQLIYQKPVKTQQRRQAPRGITREEVMFQQGDDRHVVELFHKKRSVHSEDLSRCNSRHKDTFIDDTMPDKNIENNYRQLRRVKYNSRRYEQPTVASQMKQATLRYYHHNGNYTSIPFIVSKSTAPSHNIGVNIQQVLNGFKNQQPLSCIPLTIAHHMGLGHVPYYKTNNAQPTLANREINAIRLGGRLVRLPCYKYVSYSRLLHLYREGDGVVSRFLHSIDRPQHIYSSMYKFPTSLATRSEHDGATVNAKSHDKHEEAKRRLANYAALYREYEQTEKRLRENYTPELELRKEELVKQLASREEIIRKVVEDYRSSNAGEGLRASASVAEDTYRMSTVKLRA